MHHYSHSYLVTNMQLNRKYYYDNLIHLHSYDINDKNVFCRIINKEKKYINSITFSYCEDNIEVNVNSSSEVIDLNFEVHSFFFLGELKIINYVIDNEKHEFSLTNYALLREKEKLFGLRGDNKKKYVADMVNNHGCKKENLTYKPFNHDKYWNCTCGETNVSDTCINCGNSRETLFSSKIDLQTYNKKNFNFNYVSFTGLLIFFLIHVLIINIVLQGDILYSNKDLNSFFSIFNRFIVPSAILGLSLIVSLFNDKLTKISKLVLNSLSYVLLLYMNLIMIYSISNVSYNFVITLGYDAVYLSYFIKLIIDKNQKIKNIIYSSILSVSILYSFGQIAYLNQYSFTVGTNNIILHPKNEEDIKVPEVINKLNVVKVSFDDKNYSLVKSIYISKNVTSISTVRVNNTPNLNNIFLDENNKNFYLDDGALYYSNNNRIALIPTAKESLRINSKIIYSGSFSYWNKVKKIIIGKDVETIQDDAFKDCESLEEVIFEDGNLKSIGNYSFANCINLKKISLPNTLNRIGIGALANASSLKELTLPYLGPVRYLTPDISNKNTIQFIFGNNISQIQLDTLTLTNQSIIENSTFYLLKVKKIILNEIDGDSLGIYSFKNSSIEELIIPEGVKELKKECFANCSSLKKIVLPSTLEIIGLDCFKNTNNIEIFDASKVNKSNLVIENGNESIQSYFD